MQDKCQDLTSLPADTSYSMQRCLDADDTLPERLYAVGHPTETHKHAHDAEKNGHDDVKSAGGDAQVDGMHNLHKSMDKVTKPKLLHPGTASTGILPRSRVLNSGKH